jgi:hypothetical protein
MTERRQIEGELAAAIAENKKLHPGWSGSSSQSQWLFRSVGVALMIRHSQRRRRVYSAFSGRVCVSSNIGTVISTASPSPADGVRFSSRRRWLSGCY